MSEPRPLRYAEMRPNDAAAHVVLSYWAFDVHALPDPAFVHRVWPDGCVSLVLVIAGGRVQAARVQGVFTAPLEIPVHAGVRYCGVRFRPEAGATWCGLDAASLVGANLDARETFGASLDMLLDAAPLAHDDDALAAACDAWIVARLAAEPARGAIDTMVQRAVDRLIADDGRTRIADLADELGLSARTLQRRFLAAVGVSPKMFAQLRRARRMLQRAVQEGLSSKVGWSGVAAEAGYADQAHLTREVGRLTQMSPTRLEERLNTIEHARLVD